MKRKIRLLILLCIVSLFTKCNNIQNSSIAKCDSNIDNIMSDTIEITLGDKYLYYPFGEFTTVYDMYDSIKKQCNNLNIDTIKHKDITSYVMTDGDLLHIDVLLWKETGKVEIVNAHFTGSDIRLKPGLYINMTKEQVYKLFSISPQENASCLCVNSEVDGIVLYITFSQYNKVSDIRYVSDFQLDL